MEQRQIRIPRQAGIAVRERREERGITRRQLASMAGVSERLLASLELGHASGIGLDKLLSTCAALDLSLTIHPTGEAPATPIPAEKNKVESTPESANQPYELAYQDFLRRSYPEASAAPARGWQL